MGGDIKKISNLEPLSLNDANVRRKLIPELDLDNVTHDEVLAVDCFQLAVPKGQGKAWDHFGKGFHDLVARVLLIKCEQSEHEDKGPEHGSHV